MWRESPVVRVVAGRLRGRQLRTVRGQAVRPTSDRVKTCIFDTLGSRVEGAEVLDLFAGSGALGIEALSRGAARVVFVERSPRVLVMLQKNIATLGLTSQVEVVCADVLRYLHGWRRAVPFDLILADPPYAFSAYETLLGAVAEKGLLSSAGVLVLEHRREVHPASSSPRLQLLRRRDFGTTAVTWFIMRGEAHEDRHLPRNL